MGELKAIVKRYSTFSLVLIVVILNIWLLNNGEAILPPDIYTQELSIIYSLLLALIMGIWFITLYAEGRTHVIKELYDISIKDSLIGIVLGVAIIGFTFWMVLGVFAGRGLREMELMSLLGLIILHGVIVAPIETITAQKMIVDVLGYVPAAIFFAGMHGAVYGFQLGSMLFAFIMGYIWSRMIGFKSTKWYYGMFGMGFVIAWHATYNIMLTVYQEQMMVVLSFASPYLLVGIVIIGAICLLKSRLTININRTKDYRTQKAHRRLFMPLKTNRAISIAIIAILLSSAILIGLSGVVEGNDYPEEEPPEPPPNTRPYLLEPPFNTIWVDVEFEWEGRVAVEDNDTIEWNIATNMTEEDYTEYEWRPDNYSVKLKIKCAQPFARWINVSAWDLFFPPAYWNWTVYCNYTGGTNYYWTGNGDAYQWDDYNNWLIETGGVFALATVGEYPKDNADQAFINETANTIYVQDGANTVLTIGNLKTDTGFTGTLNLSVDMVFDNAGGHDGNLTVNVGTYDVNGSADNQNNLDGNLTIDSSATLIEHEGIFIVQGAQVQEIRVQSTNALYKLTTDTASTVGELYDNLTAFQLTIGTGSTYKADANTRGYELWTNFTDVASCGFVSTSAGTLQLTGASSGRGANITTADASPPPTNYWAAPHLSTISLVIDYATISYMNYFGTKGTVDVEDSTFDNSQFDTFLFNTGATLTKFDDNTLSNAGRYGLMNNAGADLQPFNNIVITSATMNDIYAVNRRVELLDSNFDVTNVFLSGTAGNIISKTHNDIANAYKIMAITLSKSTITNDYDTLSDVQLISGTFTIDETSASNDFTVDSGSTLILNTAQTHTFDPDGNMTVNGIFKSDGTIATSSGYFDFYNPGAVWLNNSTVSSADLNYYHGGFNFSVGNSANSTINEWTLESPSGIDTAFNITFYDFSRKDSGVIWHMNATASSGSIKICTTNLTADETYRSYVDAVQHTEGTASGDAYNFTVSMSTKHINLTWVSGIPPEEEPGKGQFDTWTIGFNYSKHQIYNIVKFEAIVEYKYHISWYIWDFGDGGWFESDQPTAEHRFQWGFYSMENITLTVIAGNGVKLKMSHDVVLDNTLWVGVMITGMITIVALTVIHNRRRRQKVETWFTEKE